METDEEKSDDFANHYRGVGIERERCRMINEAARLNQVIRDSEEYRRYLDAKKEIMDNQELYQAMNAFRRRNYELQNYDDGINRYEDIHNLTLEYEKVLRNPLVNRFLMAEQVLVRTMAEMYELIANGLELDYSYME